MSSKIKLVIGVLLVIVLVVVGVSLLTGGDDDDDPGTSQSSGKDGGDDGDDGDDDDEPALKTVATKRGEGKYATAAVSANMQKPGEIWLRVSAAPKQEVSGSWNVQCGAGNVADDTFTVTPPHEQKLEIPGKNVKSCIAGASAQLDGSGRLKLTILRDR
jgi:hypothetical protein